jgi:hypothetical protein
MKKLMMAAAAIICFVLVAGTVNAQDFKDGMKFKSRDVEKTRDGSNANIIYRIPATDETGVAGPVAKGGTDKGDCGCQLTFDNYTEWYVEIYIDGASQGIVGPWQKNLVTVNSGKRKVYMITAGGSKEWSVDSGTCKGKFTWGITK